MTHSKVLVIALVALAGGIGCATSVQYQDSSDLDPMSTKFGYEDVRITADAMIQSMLVSPATAEMTAKRRPIVTVARIKNETDQHLNMTDLAGAIRTQLIRSGRFRFTNTEGRQDMQQEIDYQNKGGMVNRATATAKGQQLGAEYLLSGRLVSYRATQKRDLRKTYRLTLELANLQTGILEWADEKDITKAETRGAVGW